MSTANTTSGSNLTSGSNSTSGQTSGLASTLADFRPIDGPACSWDKLTDIFKGIFVGL